jgi:hypothetical protein
LPALDRKVRDRKERHRLQCELALKEFDTWHLRSDSLSGCPGEAKRAARAVPIE